nr:12941_t:CDS:1 [Entrophospora candida]
MVKKNRTCERCGYTCATPQKLREHLKRKNPCRPQAPIAEPEIITNSANMQGIEPIPYKNLNDRNPGETVKQWGSRLRKRIKYLSLKDRDQPKNLAECKALYDELLQMDDEAYDYIEPTKLTKEEEEFFGEPEIEVGSKSHCSAIEGQVSQPVRHEVSRSTESQVIDSPRPKGSLLCNKGSKTAIDQTNEEFERLSMITGDYEKNLVFREQQLGPALKRRAVAVHNAKVPRYHPDNGSDIRKILESQRKPFRDLLEKEFDKRGQFKFALCSLTKFLVDKKPGADKEADKNKKSRTDWLRNKQIIVYNRAEIDDYLSNAFEQILYQVEERGGKSNA